MLCTSFVGITLNVHIFTISKGKQLRILSLNNLSRYPLVKSEQVEHFPSLSALWPHFWAQMTDRDCCPGQLSYSTSCSMFLMCSSSGNPCTAQLPTLGSFTSCMKDGGRKTEVMLPYVRCVRHRQGS